jgi:transposase
MKIEPSPFILFIHPERFPGYAPELNPDEFVWTNLKGHLANAAPKDVKELLRLINHTAKKLKGSKNLLWSCIYASDLPWEK